MRLFVATEQRFVIHNGVLHASGVQHYRFWQRYIQVFDRVTIVARAKEVESVPPGWLVASGDRVDFMALPYYHGPAEFLRVTLQAHRSAGVIAREDGAFILRVPGTIGTLLWLHLAHIKKRFALEVVQDPWDVMSPRVWGNQGIQPLRLLSTYLLRRQCRGARAGVAYVTKRALQHRYPASPEAPVASIATGIRAPDGLAEGDPVQSLAPEEGDIDRASDDHRPRRYRLVFVGTMAALYKGQEVLLRAVSLGIGHGLQLELVMIGGGVHRGRLEALSRDLGLAGKVSFAGHLSSHDMLFDYLRKADLFVLPSFAEGLPRAMLEAMACGLPCIGTAVGGVPELLPAEDLVPPGKPEELAGKIEEVLSDPGRMRRMAMRNRQVAQEYLEETLQYRRDAFYQQVIEATRDADRLQVAT